MSDLQHYRHVDTSFLKPAEQVECEQIKPELIFVSIDDLVFDKRFQRDIERRGKSNIEAIANEFSWGRFTPLLVSPVGGGLFSVIDGQHRAHAASLCGHKTVPAMSVAMSTQEQARAFSWVNGNVTSVSGFHIYRAALAALDVWAVCSNKVVADAGCTLMTHNNSTSSKQAGQVYCIAAVRKYVEDGKGKIVTLALKALMDSSEGASPAMYSAEVLRPWFSTVELAGDTTQEELVAFIEANPFQSILSRVAKLRDTPEFFQKSTRSLIEKSMHVLFKNFRANGGFGNV